MRTNEFHIIHKFGFVTTASFCVFLIAIIALCASGAHINITASLPKGLYWTVAKSAEKGDLVTFYPPATPVFKEAAERGYIHRGQAGLIKKIVAVAGDKVTVSPNGITVNGVQLKNDTIHIRDGMGRPLSPHYLDDYELAPDEVFLYSDYTSSSFDSRYFGVQNRNFVKDVVRPVLIYVSSY